MDLFALEKKKVPKLFKWSSTCSWIETILNFAYNDRNPRNDRKDMYNEEEKHNDDEETKVEKAVTIVEERNNYNSDLKTWKKEPGRDKISG